MLLYLEQRLGLGATKREAWISEWISAGFTTLETMLSERPLQAFMAGDAPTLADICLVPQMYNARRFAVDLDPYPRLRAIMAAAEALPAFAAAAPPT